MTKPPKVDGRSSQANRERYYEVLAYVRLGQRNPAVEALNRLRKEHPDHLLIAAVEELSPPVSAQAPKGSTPSTAATPCATVPLLRMTTPTC